jgi:GTP cyclohydrolase II
MRLSVQAAVRTSVRIPLRLAGAAVPPADVMTFAGLVDGRQHLAIGVGPWRDALLAGTPLPVRLHSECLTGDVLGSERCDCGPQLAEALERLGATGLLLYLRQEGRGIGLYAKLDAYALQDTGLDTYEANLALGHGADERDYTAAAQMLHALGAERVELLSNNPDKARQLQAHGVDVVRRTPTGVHLSPTNARYLQAKVERTGHTITLPAQRLSAAS